MIISFRPFKIEFGDDDGEFYRTNVKGIQTHWYGCETEQLEGVQISPIVNIINSEEGGLNCGLQGALFNLAEGKFNGVQFGLVNVGERGNYLQIGLLNLRCVEEREPWYKYFTPLLRFHREKI